MIKSRFQAIMTAASLSFSLGAFSSACDEVEDEAVCGWDAAYASYACGSDDGPEPTGTHPMNCPDTLIEGAPCEDVGASYSGCCDADGAMWFCAGDLENGDYVVRVECE
jgi:hypothetical protein